MGLCCGGGFVRLGFCCSGGLVGLGVVGRRA